MATTFGHQTGLEVTAGDDGAVSLGLDATIASVAARLASTPPKLAVADGEIRLSDLPVQVTLDVVRSGGRIVPRLIQRHGVRTGAVTGEDTLLRVPGGLEARLGDVTGHAVYPLIPAFPEAAAEDPARGELLALVDAIRIGKSRERAFATQPLAERLMPLPCART